MGKRTLPAAAVLFLFTACHGYIPPRYDPAVFTRTYKSFDLTWFWKTERKDGAYN